MFTSALSDEVRGVYNSANFLLQEILSMQNQNPQKKRGLMKDIRGQRFGRLTAIAPTEKRDAKGFVVWNCKCDCGRELDVSYNALLYTNMKSCGCQKRKHEESLHGFLEHVDGTSINMLKSKKVPTNNTTGVKGVYLFRGKYVAKIVFQKKQYVLGSFGTLEEAASVRQEAETHLNDTVVTHYGRWKDRAAADPTWAEANPVKFIVKKSCDGGLDISCLPELA